VVVVRAKVVVVRWEEINRDGVDGGLKLRSPSMIVFDMNARSCDNKIKIGITFNVL